MTAPSAKYEAVAKTGVGAPAGVQGGIINIILEDATERTVGGQVSASVGIPAEYRLDGSFSASAGPWTVFGNGGLRYSRYFSEGFAERRSELPGGTELLREDLEQERSDRAASAFAGFDYAPTEATTLSASYSYYFQLDDDLTDVA